MCATIINGKEIAERIRQEIKEKTKTLPVKPKLAVILVGDDEASKIYVKNKQKAADSVGIDTLLYTFEENTKEKELEDLIDRLNKDTSVHGILVQLPLPDTFDEEKILNRIDPKKDVDGFHPLNMGLLQNGSQNGIISATPKGVLTLIQSTGVDLEGKNALIIGRSNIVGKPMAMLLLRQDCTITIAHSKTKNLRDLCKNADIIVSATGCAGLIKADWVKKGVMVFDVGICRGKDGKLCGDVDFEKMAKVASFITPVPGGVGPMTIASLLENTLQAYLKQAS